MVNKVGYVLLGLVVGAGLQCVTVRTIPTNPQQAYEQCVLAYESCQSDLEDALNLVDELNVNCH